jgi:hypothetical protein
MRAETNRKVHLRVDRETNRQAHIRVDRETNRQAYLRADRETNRQVYLRVDKENNRQANMRADRYQQRYTLGLTRSKQTGTYEGRDQQTGTLVVYRETNRRAYEDWHRDQQTGILQD